MNNFKKTFPVLSTCTYLNTAASGLLFDSLLDHRQERDLDFLIQGSDFMEHRYQFLNSLRNTIAEFVQSPGISVALTPNFSLGFQTVLNGLSTNQKVLLLDTDYPSVNHAVISRGFKTCYTQINASLEENIETAMTSHRPDILALSLVNYRNGIAIAPNFLQSLKSSYPDTLIIADGTQFLGTTAFDFKNSGIDILGASGYKWLLGGYGNGFFLFQNNALDRCTPQSYKNTALHSDYDHSYTSDLARFEPGHLDLFNFGSLQYSLNYLSQIGLLSIEKKINDLKDYAKIKLNKLEVLEEDTVQRKHHSNILNIKGDLALHQFLRSKNIITSMRGNGIRLSLHFYNTMEDINYLLEALKPYSEK